MCRQCIQVVLLSQDFKIAATSGGGILILQTRPVSEGGWLVITHSPFKHSLACSVSDYLLISPDNA